MIPAARKLACSASATAPLSRAWSNNAGISQPTQTTLNTTTQSSGRATGHGVEAGLLAAARAAWPDDTLAWPAQPHRLRQRQPWRAHDDEAGTRDGKQQLLTGPDPDVHVRPVADGPHQRDEDDQQAKLEQQALTPQLLPGGIVRHSGAAAAQQPAQAGQVCSREDQIADQHRPAGRPVRERYVHRVASCCRPAACWPCTSGPGRTESRTPPRQRPGSSR